MPFAESQGRELPMQPKARRSGFVTTNDLFGQGDLLLSPLQEIRGLEGLGRLSFGSIHHAHRHDAGRVNIQRQLDLLELGLSSASFACDLLPAGLRVRTNFVMHILVDVANSLRVRQHSCHLSSISDAFEKGLGTITRAGTGEPPGQEMLALASRDGLNVRFPSAKRKVKKVAL